MKNALKSTLVSIILGNTVMIVGLTVFAGSVEAALGVVFLSIACTFGAGIFFWLGIGYLVGRTVSEILLTYVYHDTTLKYNSPDIQSLIQYIHDAQSYGVSQEEIKKQLSAKGWNNNQIKLAFEHVSVDVK